VTNSTQIEGKLLTNLYPVFIAKQMYDKFVTNSTQIEDK